MKIDHNHKLISHLYTIFFLLILPALFLSGTIFAANTNISITIVTGDITTGGNQNQGGSYYSKKITPSTQTGPNIINTTGTTLGDDGWTVIEDWINQIDGTTTKDEQEGHAAAEIIYTTIIGGGPNKILNLLENNVYINTPTEKHQTEFEIGGSINQQITHADLLHINTNLEQGSSIWQSFVTVFNYAKKIAVAYTYSLTRLAFDLIKGDSTRMASIIFSQVMAY